MRSATIFEEYLDSGRFKEGLKQCEKRLKKSNAGVDLWVYKAKFLFQLGQRDEALKILTSLVTHTPAITDTLILDDIDAFLLQIDRDTQFPLVLTNGPTSNKLWTACLAVTPKKDVLYAYQDRFNSAVRDRRWQDAGSAIAGWRQVEPQRQDLRSMQIALFQVIATSTKDFNVARLNTMLATKHIEKFIHQDINDADVMLVLDTLIRQRNTALLIQLAFTPDAPLSQVLCDNYEAFRQVITYLAEHGTLEIKGVAERLIGWIWSLVPGSESRFLTSLASQARARNDWLLHKAAIIILNRLDSAGLMAIEKLPDSSLHGNLRQFLLIDMWTQHQTQKQDLYGAVTRYFAELHSKPFCFGDLREFVLDLSCAEQTALRAHLHSFRTLSTLQGSTDLTAGEIRDWITTETNVLKLEYLLTISMEPRCSRKTLYRFILNTTRLVHLADRLSGQPDTDSRILLVYALWRAYEMDTQQGHLFMALSALESLTLSSHCYPALVLAIAVAKELGLGGLALNFYRRLDVKAIQLETVSHIGLAGISTLAPLANGEGISEASGLLTKTLYMYQATDAGLLEQQQALLRAQRADLLMPLEDLRRVLNHSVNRRIMILEQRRIYRFAAMDQPDESQTLHPPTLQMWTEDLEDRRDFNILPNLEAAEYQPKMEIRVHGFDKNQGRSRICYDLWIDNICSIITMDKPLTSPLNSTAPALPPGALSDDEALLTEPWECLAFATRVVTDEVSLARSGISEKRGIDMVRMLGQKLSVAANLILEKGLVGNTGRIPYFPGRAILRSYFLLIELVQAVARLAIHGKNVSKGKLPGKKVPWELLDDLCSMAHTTYEDVKRAAVIAQHELSAESIKDAIAAQHDLLRTASLGDETADGLDEFEETQLKEAGELCKSGREAWGEMLKLSFPV